MTATGVPEKCMVSQILSSLIFAGSRIQVPNVWSTLTKCTGLPTEVMTHSRGEKAPIHYRSQQTSKQQLVTVCSRLPSLFEGPGVLSSVFPARVSSFGTAQVSATVEREKVKRHFSLSDMTDMRINYSTEIKE